MLDAATRPPGHATRHPGLQWGRIRPEPALPEPRRRGQLLPCPTCSTASPSSPQRASPPGWANLRGVSTASVRLASVYGEMERPTRPATARASSIACSLDGPVTVSGEDIVRDWVHADDVALAVARLLTDEPYRLQLFHIGGGEPVGWRRIVDVFRRSGWPIASAPTSDAADIG